MNVQHVPLNCFIRSTSRSSSPCFFLSSRSAFLAGVIISGSDYGHETLARLLPLRDAFVALFFVTIGVLIDPRTIISNWSLLLTMIALIVAVILLIWTTVVRLFGYSLVTAFLVGIGLTQIGEFSFVLVQVAKTAGHVGSDVYNATLVASLITILLNALMHIVIR